VTTIRVVLLDDDELAGLGVRAALAGEDDLELVGVAATVPDGVTLVEATRPDVVLVDLMAPPGAGIDACRAFREHMPDVACVVLTSRMTDEVLLAAVRADVSGFILKHMPVRDLIRSIRAVAAGETLIDPTLAARLLEQVRRGHTSFPEAGLLADLSTRERCLLDHLGEGLPNREIAERMNLAEKTVKNYVSGLLSKLGMRSRTEAAVYVTNLRATGREVCA
jgi:DNA-binding NarL/FixJ family response regulator